MIKKKLISTNFGSKNNLYLSNIIICGTAKNKKLMNLILSKNNAYFL